jgi:hypothetical protein
MKKCQMPLLLEDVTIGICMYTKKSLGSWDKDDYTKGVFTYLHSPSREDSLVNSELLRAATLHYFKEPGRMAKLSLWKHRGLGWQSFGGTSCRHAGSLEDFGIHQGAVG